MKYKRLNPHQFWIEEDRRKRILAVPILMEDWDINARAQTSFVYPSNLLTKLVPPDVCFEKVIFRPRIDAHW